MKFTKEGHNESEELFSSQEEADTSHAAIVIISDDKDVLNSVVKLFTYISNVTPRIEQASVFTDRYG